MLKSLLPTSTFPLICSFSLHPRLITPVEPTTPQRHALRHAGWRGRTTEVSKNALGLVCVCLLVLKHSKSAKIWFQDRKPPNNTKKAGMPGRAGLRQASSPAEASVDPVHRFHPNSLPSAASPWKNHCQVSTYQHYDK